MQADSLGNNHVIYVISLDKLTIHKLVGYDRHITLAWAPRGDHLLLNNYRSSTDANCHVFILTNRAGNLDVEELDIGQLLAQQVSSESPRMGHKYVEGLRWVDDVTLYLKVTAYDPVVPSTPSEWHREYTYALGKSFTLIK
jgi:hypothetical protein